MNILQVMVVFYFCSIIAKSINNVCLDRPPTIENLSRARRSKCTLADHSFLSLDFFDFQMHYDLVREFAEWNEQDGNFTLAA